MECFAKSWPIFVSEKNNRTEMKLWLWPETKKFRRKLVAENFRFSPAMNLKRDFRRTIFASIGLGEVSLPAQLSWPRPSWRSLRSWCFRSSPPGRGSTSRPPPRSSSPPTRWACDGARRWRCSRCRPERRQRWFADQGSRVRIQTGADFFLLSVFLYLNLSVVCS